MRWCDSRSHWRAAGRIEEDTNGETGEKPQKESDNCDFHEVRLRLQIIAHDYLRISSAIRVIPAEGIELAIGADDVGAAAIDAIFVPRPGVHEWFDEEAEAA